MSTLIGGYFRDGQGRSARFYHPTGVAVDAAGNLYVADTYNCRIRKISPEGDVTTLAGAGAAGSRDGNGLSAQFLEPTDVAVDPAGNLLVADGPTIRRIDPAGDVATFAGSASATGSLDGTRATARFGLAFGVASTAAGDLFVSDTLNNKLLRISGDRVDTLAGSGAIGSADGTGLSATFNGPAGIAADSSGNLLVADALNLKVRKVTGAGTVTTVASSGLLAPTALDVDASGTIFVCDGLRIRKISDSGVSTLAGGGLTGFLDENGLAARFSSLLGVALASGGDLYVADSANHAIRKITPAGRVTTVAGGIPSGFADGPLGDSLLARPTGVAVSPDGTRFIADASNKRIRKVTPEGIVSTLAGSDQSGHDDGEGSSATFLNPKAISAGPDGTLYVIDFYSIRRVSPTGIVKTVASAIKSYGLAVDASGSVLFTDYDAGIVGRMAEDGTVTTVASGPAAGTAFAIPAGIAVAPGGAIFVSDMARSTIYRIDPSGTVRTLAGNVQPGYKDGTDARFNMPGALALDRTGNLYVADTGNYRIRKVAPDGTVSTVAGSGRSRLVDGTGAAASFSSPDGLAIDIDGSLLVTDSEDSALRVIR